jgi:hypothetical protein
MSIALEMCSGVARVLFASVQTGSVRSSPQHVPARRTPEMSTGHARKHPASWCTIHSVGFPTRGASEHPRVTSGFARFSVGAESGKTGPNRPWKTTIFVSPPTRYCQ